MQVFKLFMLILKKKLPLALTFVVAFMGLYLGLTFIDKGEEKFTESKLNIVITDNDNTPESKALMEYIGKKHSIVTPTMPLKDALYFATVDYALTINKGYAEKLAEGGTDGMFVSKHVYDSYSVAYMGSWLDEYVSCVRACMASGEDISEAIKSAEEAMDINTEVTMVSSDAGNANGFMTGSGFFRYLPYILLSLMIAVLSPVMISINSKEVRFRTNCSNVRPTSCVLQILAGSVVYVLVIWLLFTALGMICIGGVYKGIIWLNVLNSAIFAVIAAFIAVLVSMLIRSHDSVNLVCNIVSLTMCFLCGVFIPQSLLGDTVLSIGRFLPAYWYVKVSNMLTGADVFNASKAMQYLLIEAGFAVALGIIATLLYKTKLRSAEF
ncbi:ABC transporter permease [Ruminococcus albus]|uniref:ABC-2 type transport system permease protein n=1 Tax=Ruminococcus albus TaxID=1264 RepID=A0A1I1I5U6_RUMAL|nr:ABC transporter permease [Ruminococcus albus]SFC29063.1 ABC-2 type transport system permease protein [Ruminococcus albus]